MPRILTLNESERQLVYDLLSAHATNLEGHLAALDDDPHLVLVAPTGRTRLEAELSTTLRLRYAVRPADAAA